MFGSAPTHALASRPVSGKPLAMMMFWRSLWVWLSFRLRGPLDALGTSRLQLRVRPGDIDMNLHMNNGRYFSVADLGRLDLGLRSRVWLRAFKRGWRPMAGDSNAPFSRSEEHPSELQSLMRIYY